MADKEKEDQIPIEEMLIDIAKEISQEEWNKLRKDMNDNLDHYLYGGPKKCGRE